MKIIVFGSDGQVGSCLRNQFEGTSFNIIYTNRKTHDVSNHELVNNLISIEQPDFVINTSGYTAVDQAEIETQKAYEINSHSVTNMAEACKKNDSIFIHLSTDYVFDGKLKVPYKESAHTKPLNIYGKSKLFGEIGVIKSGCKFIILRTSWVFSEFSTNFVKTIIKLMQTNKSLRIVSDERGNPTSAHDIASSIKHIIPLVKKDISLCGIYHIAGNETLSWYDFANKIKENLKTFNINLDCNLSRIKSKDFGAKAKRPKYSVLDCNKFMQTFDKGMLDIDQNINKVLSKLSY